MRRGRKPKKRMSALRWNPVLEEWVITAPDRQTRPLQVSGASKKECLLCPHGFEVPTEYDICVFENRFPSLQRNPPPLTLKGDQFYKIKNGRGICEVVLYSPHHNRTLTTESENQIYKLINVWQDRYRELGSYNFIKYVFIFENKGEVIGVTLSHPHGQIYAFPYIPPIIKRELSSSRRHMARTGKCLFCEILQREIGEKKRIVWKGKHFAAFVPFYARWPYEVHIYSCRHRTSMLEFGETEKRDLARVLKKVLVKYDKLFGFSFPYMMVIHQAPTDGKEYSYYHFHIEFYPPYRSRDKIKFLGGCESGAGSFINDTSAEEKAAELRKSNM